MVYYLNSAWSGAYHHGLFTYAYFKAIKLTLIQLKDKIIKLCFKQQRKLPLRDILYGDIILPLSADNQKQTLILRHSGRTTGAGSHNDLQNRSGLGSHHFHHTHAPHLPCCRGQTGRDSFIINPYTGRQIALGQPFMFQNQAYFSLNLVAKALTEQDGVGVTIFSDHFDDMDGVDGGFFACNRGSSDASSFMGMRLGEFFSIVFPRTLFGNLRNLTFFNTSGNRGSNLELLCYTTRAPLDTIDCFAYVTLENIRRYMLAERFFAGFSPNQANIWSFDYGASSSRITLPHRNQLFFIGSTFTVQADIVNAATVALRINEQIVETKTIPIGERIVEFSAVEIITGDDLVLSVEVQRRSGNVTVLDSVPIRVLSPLVDIRTPHDGDVYNMGDEVVVRAYVHGASSAELVIGEHRQEITNLQEWSMLDFASYIPTVDDVGELDVTVNAHNPYGITATGKLRLQVRHKGFKEQTMQNRDGTTVRILTYETNPVRERVELYFGDSNPDGRNHLETVRTVAGRTSPKAAINAGFFPLTPADKSIGWAYSEIHGMYEGDGRGGRPDRERPIARDDPGYHYFHTLFYYRDGTSEVIRTMSLTRAKVIEKSANAVFIVSGTRGRIGDAITTAPRSMVGVKADGSVIFLTADSGRTNPNGTAIRSGIDVTQGANILEEMGAIEVLNLDGGGSTQFFYNDQMRTDPMEIRNGVLDFRQIGSVLKVYDK